VQRFQWAPGPIDVRKLPAAVAISAAIHVVAVLYLGSRNLGDELAPEPELTPIEPVEAARALPVESPPIDLVLLEPAPTAAPEIQPSRRTRPDRSAPALAAIETPHAGSAASIHDAQDPRDAHDTPRNPWMTMRRPDLAGPAATARWDDLVHPPAGTAPEHDATARVLKPSGSGTSRYEQPAAADSTDTLDRPFAIEVDADGTAHFKDGKSFNVHFAVPGPKAIATWYKSEKGDLVETADMAVAKMIQASIGATGVVVPIIAGGFDTTDWLMRRRGQDPYASAKLHVLDATRDERAQLHALNRDRQLGQSTVLIQRTLDDLWATVADPATRKQALFELWDDCAEVGDVALVEGARTARLLIVGFIRARLRAGGTDAYTAAELAACNRARRSTAPFAPYE
jgi:hypothetical protein